MGVAIQGVAVPPEPPRRSCSHGSSADSPTGRTPRAQEQHAASVLRVAQLASAPMRRARALTLGDQQRRAGGADEEAPQCASTQLATRWRAMRYASLHEGAATDASAARVPPQKSSTERESELDVPPPSCVQPVELVPWSLRARALILCGLRALCLVLCACASLLITLSLALSLPQMDSTTEAANAKPQLASSSSSGQSTGSSSLQPERPRHGPSLAQPIPSSSSSLPPSHAVVTPPPLQGGYWSAGAQPPPQVGLIPLPPPQLPPAPQPPPPQPAQKASPPPPSPVPKRPPPSSSPSPPLPPTLPPIEPVWEALNRRFREGDVANTLEEAGVLVREFDNLHDPHQPWLPCPRGIWCEKFGDRWATTLINKDARKVYYETHAGFVLAPTVEFYCVYSSDGNSMESVCPQLFGSPDCTPGCGAVRCWPHHDWLCSFPPTQLRQALAAQKERQFKSHNEVVVDPRSVVRNLPHSLLAVFFMSEDDREEARAIHAHFLQAFGLSFDQFPLLHLELYGDTLSPFTPARE